MKILGSSKYEGKILKKSWEIRDGAKHGISIVNNKAISSRYYGNDDGLVWMCGGSREDCSYYSEESWDGDPQNLKK